jgi:filamentous hemagglutinin
MFFLVLRDSGRDDAAGESGYAAIDALFPGSAWSGDISLTSREIKTRSGGDISLFAPGGKLTVGFDAAGNQPLEQGILTESGGNIHLFTNDDVIVGTSRIFTLRGGNEIIWSSAGDIAAGSSAKTVQSAPPTRVLIDPQSGDVQTDLAGLATGGGIGVLATVEGVPPGDVDLIAPKGTVDAGDAGIRVSGNLQVAAAQVLNAGNIAVTGSSAGTPASVPSAPSAPVVATSSSTAAASTAASQQVAPMQAKETAPAAEDMPSVFTVEVIGYGGDEGEEDEEEKRKKAKAAETEQTL